MKLLSWSKSASVAALAFTAIAACTAEPIEPVAGRFDGIYVAISLGGGAIPRTVTLDGEQRTLLADTLRFFSDGSSVRTQVLRLPGDVISRYTTTLKYQVDGTKLMFILNCPPNALCAGPQEGIIVESRITFPYSTFFGPQAGVLVLTRVEKADL